MKHGIRKVVARTRKVGGSAGSRHDAPSGDWIDHPDMKRRLAEAEADRRAGRVTRLETPDAIEKYLDCLA